MDPLEKEPCDKVQIFVLNFLATILTQFTDKVAFSMRKLIVEIDHSQGDTGMYAVEQAHMVAKHYLDTLNATTGTLTSYPTKAIYYQTVFAMVDDLLPAIKGVESYFGDAIALDGLPCSRIIKAILENA